MGTFKTKKFQALGVPRGEAKNWKKQANAMIDQAPGVIAKPMKGGNRKKASPPSPSRIPNGAGSSRPTPNGATYGNGQPGKRLSEAGIMAGADSDLKAIWLAQQASGERPIMLADSPESPQPSRRVAKKAAKKLAAAGVDPQAAAVMLSSDTDPELLQLWMSGLIAQRRAEIAEQGQRQDDQWRMKSRPPAAPLGMDDDRFALHVEAKELAATKMGRDPRIDEGQAYILALNEVNDRKFGGPI